MKKKMKTDLDTAKLLAKVFGNKIYNDIEITLNGGDKERCLKKEYGID